MCKRSRKAECFCQVKVSGSVEPSWKKILKQCFVYVMAAYAKDSLIID
jgi:uncharacterized sporulation protein YeaH/YhbH (DUF444 family)